MLHFPVCHWGSSVAGFIPYFDGTQNLRRAAAFDGMPTTKTALLFISFKPDSLGGSLMEFAGIQISLQAQGGEMRINVTIGNGFHMRGFEEHVNFDAGEWGTVLIEIDMADFGPMQGNATVKVYINDAADTFQPISANAGFNLPLGATPQRVASNRSDGGLYAGCIEKLWFAADENLDFDVQANRLKFYNADLTPKDLGDNGEIPTGNIPIVYFNSTTDTFEVNLGSGGDMSVLGGPLTECSTNPTDNPPD